jgi:hypothetical protein
VYEFAEKRRGFGIEIGNEQDVVADVVEIYLAESPVQQSYLIWRLRQRSDRDVDRGLARDGRFA